MAKQLIIVFLAVVVGLVSGYGEPNPTGYPSWEERTFIALLNAARANPPGYLSTYMSSWGWSTSGILTTGPVPPMYIDPGLSQSSRYHSNDVATNCPYDMQADDCNGGSWVTRIENYYSCGTISEDLMYTYPWAEDPLDSVNSILCSFEVNAYGQFVCCPDGNSCAGSRSVVLSSTWLRVGAGNVVGNGSYPFSYWTVDVGACAVSPLTAAYPSNIASGSHYVETSTGNTRFLAQYYDSTGASPSAAVVVVNGVGYSLTLDVGSPSLGNYYLELPTAGGCRQYYFVFVDGYGNTWQYPSTGFFNTYGEGGCTADWEDTAYYSPTAPTAPQNLVSAGTTTSSISISWSAPASDGSSSVTNYIVYWNGGSASVGTATSYTISSLTAATTYTIYVIAQNSVGNSPASNVITATTNNNPSPGPCSSSSCLPASYNSRTATSCATGIMNQADCGSCYAFSTSAANSDRMCIQEQITVIISPQDILDCGQGTVWFGASGCDGGVPYYAAQLQCTRGLATSNSPALSGGCRPYLCSNGYSYCPEVCSTTCDDGSNYVAYKGTNYYSVANDVTSIQLEIYNNGPVVACFDVCQSFYNFFNSPTSYAYTTDCTPSSSDYVGGHAVTVVGWQNDAGGTPSWLVANSWGSSWNGNGYFLIERGVNLCGFEASICATSFSSSGRRMAWMNETATTAGLAKRAATITGAPVQSNGNTISVNNAAQYILDHWWFNNNGGGSSNGKRSPMRPVRSTPVGGMGSTGSPYSVSAVNSGTTQVVNGQSVNVNLVASNEEGSVALQGTVNYGSDTIVSSASSSVAAGAAGSSAALSTGAIVGIAVGGGVGLILLVGAAVVVVGAAGFGIYKLATREKDVEMAAPIDEAPKQRKSWWRKERSGPQFHSITARSPPIKGQGSGGMGGPSTPIAV